jgi:hypothetical protein
MSNDQQWKEIKVSIFQTIDQIGSDHEKTQKHSWKTFKRISNAPSIEEFAGEDKRARRFAESSSWLIQ